MRRTLVLVVAIGVLCVIVVQRDHILPCVADWLDVGQSPRNSDYVLPLAGGFETRPFVAAALVKTGFATNVLVTQVPKGPNAVSQFPASHEIVVAVMRSEGIPDSRTTILDGDCTTTYDEARVLKRWMAADTDSTVTIVTNDYHTRRARLVFRHVFENDADQLCFVSAPNDLFNDSNWWRVEQGFTTYGNEYLKFVWYSLRYGYLGVWIVLGGGVGVGLWLWKTKNRDSRPKTANDS